MKVSADIDLCQGHVMCGVEAPEVFQYDEDLDHVVVLNDNPDESQRSAVEQAVKYCPAMALTVSED